MELLFSGSVSKEYNHENEDVFDIGFIEHGVRIALSDGATVSYDSKEWAKILVNYFIKNGELSGFDIKKIIKIYYSSRFCFKDMTPIQKRGLIYGSFATILGVEYSFADNFIKVFAIGDSIAVLLDGEKLIETFPYSLSAQFKKPPQMLSTKKRNNFFFSYAKDRSKFYKVWKLQNISYPILLCMTDALGEWALRETKRGNDKVWREILSVCSAKEFIRFVWNKRDNHTIKTDDTTLISIRL
ncbi:MAG: hypothetical protein LBS39_01265 [Campylobacteraceae bacterium]|jgi:hypothetical protein|nr:hypothetical protein [Campylobacteraceae bacterium]